MRNFAQLLAMLAQTSAPFNPALLAGTEFYVGDNSSLVTSAAAAFSGSSEYLSCVQNASNTLGNIDCWFSGWFFVTDDTSNRTIISITKPTTLNGIWLFVNETTNKVFFYAGNDAGTTADLATAAGITLNAWHHAFAYYDSVGHTINLSVDGGAFLSTAFSLGIAVTGTELFVGSWGGTNWMMEGRLQAVAFGSNPPGGIAAIATSMRNALWNGGNGLFFAGLTPAQIAAWGVQSWYDFGGPNTLLDDRMGNSPLVNNGGVVLGAGHISGTPAFPGDAITVWTDQTAAALNVVPASLADSGGYLPGDLNGLSGVSLNGTTQYMNVGVAADWAYLHDGTGMTLMAVVECTVAQDGCIFATQGSAADPPGVLIYRVASTSKLQVYINNATANIISALAAGFPLNVPVVVIVTYGGTTCNVYINGTLAATATATGSPASGNPGGTLQLGASVDLHQYFGGKFYAAQSLPRLLTGAEITALSNYELNRFGLNVPISMTPSNRQLLSNGTGHTGAEFAAYPVSMHVCPNGDLICAHTRSASDGSPDLYMVLQRSTNGTTLPTVWGAETTFLANNNPVYPGGVSFTNLASGRMVCIYVTIGNTTGFSVRCFFMHSDDSGVTWSTPVDFTAASGFTEETVIGSYAVELTPGGTIIIPVYGINTGGGSRGVVLIATTDGGATFSLYSTVSVSGQISAADEPQIGRLQDGRLMLLIRDDPSQTTWVTYSSDAGLTWTALAAAFSGYAWPRWTQLTNGSIFVGTRHVDPVTTNQYGVYRLSWNAGKSWGPEQYLDPTLTLFMLYCSAVEIAPNVLSVSWCEEETSNTTLIQNFNLS